MTVDRRFLNWGVFLLAAGAVVLFAQGGGVDNDTIAQALRLWPVLLIALGLGVLLRRTRFGLAGGILAAAIPGLLLGGLVVAAPRVAFGCGGAQPGTVGTTGTNQGTFAGAALVDLDLSCGDLTVTTVPGSDWRIESHDAAGDVASADPIVAASANRLSVTSGRARRPFDFLRGGDAWRVSLPIANTLDLSAEVNAGRGRFELAGAQLGNVRLAVNAGDARVDLAEATAGHLSMSVNAGSASVRLPATGVPVADFSVNAGSLRICAPSDVGLRIRATVVLGSTNFPGLLRSGDAWESPGYASANHHADLAISVNVGSVDVNPVGGCQ